MNNGRFVESFISLILVVSAAFLVNPFGLWMPSMLHMSMLAVLVAAVGGIAAFILREKTLDERDEAHRASAGHAAFLTGSAILVAGIATQTFEHTLDPWLVAALVAMILVKVGARWWIEHNR